MKRIMVIGCCGAGKTTLSRNLGKILSLGVTHLDQHYWKAEWTETPADIWAEQVKNLAAHDSWILDGNYSGTMDIRLQRADTVIFLDYATPVCLWRIMKRVWKYRGRERPDMPPGCRERFDWNFFHYVATFNLLRRKRLLSKLATLPSHIAVYQLSNDKEVRHFLRTTVANI